MIYFPGAEARIDDGYIAVIRAERQVIWQCEHKHRLSNDWVGRRDSDPFPEGAVACAKFELAKRVWKAGS